MEHRTPIAVLVSALGVILATKYGVALDPSTQLAIVAGLTTAAHYLPSLLNRTVTLSPETITAIAKASSLEFIKLVKHTEKT